MPNSRSAPSRRTFLASTAVAAATVSGMPLLSACGGEGSGGGEGRVSEGELDSILPTFQAADLSVQPDIASEHGSSPGYTRWIPEGELDASVPRPRGSGGEFSAMTPLWGTPPQDGNAFWTAMDEAIGVRMRWQTQDGNTYGEKLGATLAGSEIPDLVCVPDWELQGQIPQGVTSRFLDLGPYLSGDAVLDYPNLAAIPTSAWQASVFGGALRGLPMPQRSTGDVVPYYREDLFEANGWEPPTSADEFVAFCQDVTSAANRVWACEDPKWFAMKMYALLPDKPLYWRRGDNGKLLNRYETEEYLEALEWARRLYEAEVVHPDSVAATGDPAVRFAAGESLMFMQGEGAWYGTAAEQAASNPDFRINAFDYFSPDGSEPVLWSRNGASIWTFINKNLSEDRVREALEIANFTAAPYGTVEQRLKQYGVEGTHYTVEDGLPVRTDQGNVDVVPETYPFICSPESFVSYPDLPYVVEAMTGWQKRNMPYVQDPIFLGRQVQEPARLANLSDGFEDLEDDVVRGRQSIRDVQNAVDDWRSGGGDELRDWYQRLLDEEEGGA